MTPASALARAAALVLTVAAFVASNSSAAQAPAARDAAAAPVGDPRIAAPHTRDPFQAPPLRPVPVAPLVSDADGAAAPAPLMLQAVIVDGAHSLANINGIIVGIDGHVDGYRVVQIDAHNVVLAKGKQRLTLTMNQKATR